MDCKTERALLLIGLLLAGCGGGGAGSNSSVLGLQGPGSISVVTPGGGSGSMASSGAVTSAAVEDFAVDSDYNTDASNANVYDPSMDTLSLVNQILCLTGQTAYTEMVNQGTYNAQVDESLCSSGADTGSSSSTGQSSSAGAEAPKIWVVDSLRESNDANQLVSFWLQQDEQDFSGPLTIRGLIDLNEGVSAENPFGLFTLNFAGVDDGTGDVENPVFFGTLETLDVLDGFIGFSFYEKRGDVNVVPDPNGFAEETAANVNMFSDQSQGVARILREERSNFQPQGDSGVLASEYLLAFDDSHVLRDLVGGASTCLSRTDFESSVWRYNLYYADGENAGMRVERNGGFGFKTANGDYGWMGYYGMWLPEGVTIENGDTVSKDAFGETPVDYTVLQAPGKLIKHTQSTLLLTEVEGMQFEYWVFQAPQMGQPVAPVKSLLEYDGLDWLVVATWDDEAQGWEDDETPDVLDVANLGVLNMFSMALGGSVNFVYGSDSLTYFTNEFINPSNELFTGSTSIDLYGYVQCLDSGITSAEADVGDVYLPDLSDVNSPYHFVFDATDMTLYWDSDGMGTLLEVGLGEGEAPTEGPFTWGMNSGSLLLDTAGLTTVYDAFNQETFFSYETGHNSWNQYAVLLDGNGDAVSFDPPIQFTYTHSTANDRNADPTYDGQKFLLSFGGPGDLGGIPSAGVDFDSDGFPDRWYPVFSINDGVAMGPDGTEFVIKAIELEQRLSEDPGNCGLLTTGPVAGLALPDGSGFTTPDIGAMPVVTDAPAVIAGVVQTGN